ncbi:hypothetical protein LPJ56_000288 [Coemansia sp. RSA 2599]|nr:hypothetical protein LPJ56_000288 [Coemansia sp. RSA 2599]
MHPLIAYILGILTLPALLAAGLFAFWALLPPADPSKQRIDYDDEALTEKRPLCADKGANQKKSVHSPYGARRTGWLRITRSLESNPPDISDGSTKITEIVARGFAKWISSKRAGTAGKRPEIGVEGSTNTMVAEGLDDLYYVVLDGDTLVMYDGEAMSECRGVIIMTKYRVSLHHRPNTSEAQVYSRKTPIRLAPLDENFEAQLYKRQVVEYYVYVDRPMDKEDWYFALMWSSLLGISSESSDEDGGAHGGRAVSRDNEAGGAMASPPGSPSQQHRQETATEGEEKPAAQPLTKEQRERLRQRLRQGCMVPDSSGIESILQTISARGASAKPGDVREDEWLNAIVGRVFVAAYRTEWARKHFIRKMQTKFDRVEKPIFLDRIVVADLDIGENVPVITVPKLERFDKDGTVDMSMYMHYMGGFKLVLNTGVKIGSLRMSVSLSVVLHSLAGRMLLRFKPAPSNRFWLGFYEMPSIRLKVAPVFMQKQVKYAVVSQAIEKQIYDIVRTTLVYPNLDDTVFFPTTVDEAAILETVLKEYYHAGLDKGQDAPVKARDQASAGSGARGDVQPSAAEEGAQGGDSQQTEQQLARRKEAAGGPRPFSMTSVELGMDHVSAPIQLSPALPERAHKRGDSVDVNHGISELNQAGSSMMVTPQPLTSNSSETEIDQQQSRGIKHGLSISTLNEEAEQALSERSVSPSVASFGSQTKAASIKSTISASAAMLFKRAKDSQAAESAKTWWQNMQQGAGSASPPPADASPSLGTAPALPQRQTADARTGLKGEGLGIGVRSQQPSRMATTSIGNRDTAQHLAVDENRPAQPAAIAVGFGQQQRYGRQGGAHERLLSRSPPQTYGSSIAQSPVVAVEADAGSGGDHSISSISSGFQFPRLNDGSMAGGAGQGNAIGGSKMADSSLVRRRPAALSQGSEIELPIQRRYSKPHQPAPAKPT